MGNTPSHQTPSCEDDGDVVIADEQVFADSMKQVAETPGNEINNYLLSRVPAFRRLTELRKQGWANPAGDKYFANQRRQADNPNDQQNQFFFQLMIKIGQEIHNYTGAFRVIKPGGDPPKILDMCMAPGAFLHVAMQYNRGAQARAFTLPVESGGHQVRLQPHSDITITPMDITMLAADMGVDVIPPEHPDANHFLPREFSPDELYDLAFCDGQVLRTHTRPTYREDREASRLSMAQLAIALEHMKPGGTMLVLLHQVESWKSIMLLWVFSKFSELQVYKPRASHRKRSSCYLVASNIQSKSEDAVRAVQAFKRLWKVSTFAPDKDEFRQLCRALAPPIRDVLEDFGPKLIELGESVWATQANALAEAPWIQRPRAGSSPRHRPVQSYGAS